MQTNNDLANRLSFKQIPVLPPGVSLLFKTLTDDSIGFIELARIIETFPSIAARLIAVANSSWSSPVTPITSLEMACSRLGFNVVRSTSIALAVAAPFDSNRCPGFNAKYFWTTSLLAADATSWLSVCSKSIQTELPTVRTAGLIHNLGLLLLADQLAEEVHLAIKLAEESEDLSLSDALLYILGFDHYDAGLLLGKAWNFPEPLVEAMAGHTDENREPPAGEIASIVGLAVSMIQSLQYSRRPWSIPQVQLEHLQIQPAEATEVFEQLSEQLTHIQEMADTLFR